ncbi:hypothetical protein BN440_1796 [Erwinia amylovora MR1]|nr:hypothetical protein BN440_1796 [Erwinia amylovora MR1]
MALRHSPVGQEYHWPLARQSVFVASRISAIAWSLILAFFIHPLICANFGSYIWNKNITNFHLAIFSTNKYV